MHLEFADNCRGMGKKNYFCSAIASGFCKKMNREKVTHSEIAIIGAGASGLFAAALLSPVPSLRLTLFEKAEQPAAKLRASGGGRANLMNTDIRPDHYNHPSFIRNLLRHTSRKEVQDAFHSLGLRLTEDEEHRVYPATLFSQTVVQVLMNHIHPQTQWHYHEPVGKITPHHGQWLINGGKQPFNQVILATGSPAGMNEKNRLHYNSYLHSLKIHTTPLAPSLSGFRLEDYPKFLFGCRARAEVTLIQAQNIVFKEQGEVTFKEDGISGIVVLNCCAHYNRLADKQNCTLHLNFLYDDDSWDIQKHLQQHGGLEGVLHPKLCRLFAQKPFNPRDLCFHIAAPYGLEHAQVCSGGIQLDEITEQFELKRFPGIYAAGEMLDVDGVCGGYNLFFAFASALTIVKKLISEIPS